MNIVVDPLLFNPENLFFMDKKKNNVIDGYFSKVIYSSELCTINGIFYLLPLVFKPPDVHIPPISPMYPEHKYTVSFYAHDIKNLQYITLLSEIENAIINTYKEMNLSKKRNILGMTSQLYKGYFKIYKEKHTHINCPSKKYVLKISGIWEDAEEIGITYKFIEVYYDSNI